MPYIHVIICGALHYLISFVQFKKRGKHPLRSVTFNKVVGFKPANLLKVTLLHGSFSRFLNFTNVTKSHNASHIFVDMFLFLRYLNIQFRQGLMLLRGLCRTHSNIENGAFCKNSWKLKAVNYFCKKLHLRCLTGNWICLCYLFSLKKTRLVRNFHSENDSVFVFETF